MPFAPERLGQDVRRRLERVFFSCVALLTTVGMLAPLGPAYALVDDLKNYAIFLVSSILEWILYFTGNLVILLVDAVISVAQYNDFANASVVQAGWPLVRDVVNMFFIVVLLVIAFSTIIQYKKFHYRAILPKLLLMAVLVNFSKTLIGVLIDFSQVVMLTFVNGFKSAAAGNFVSALKLDKVLALAQSQKDATNPTDQLVNSQLLDIVLAEMLGIFMVGTAAVTLMIMLVYLIVRVVGLWIALIMSPAAFFATALPEAMARGGGAISKDFWPRLSAMLTGGPIMAFFLWLALATVQSGGFANFTPTTVSQERQAEAGSGGVSYFASKVGNSQEVATFLVGVVMMLMGVEAAVSVSQQVNSTLGGAAKSIRSTGMAATRYASYGGLLAGTAAASRLARRGGAGAARYADSKLDVTGGLGRLTQRIGSKTPIVGTAIGKAGANLTGIRTQERTRYGKSLEAATANLGIDDRIKAYEEYAKGGNGDKQKAALMALAKLESSSDGMKSLSKRFETEGKAKNLSGEELKAYAERETRKVAAKRLDEIQELAEKTNDQDSLKYVREERQKRPDLITDDGKLKEHISKLMDDGDADDFAKMIKSQAYQDPRVMDAIIEHGKMVNADGTLNKNSAWHKALVEKGGMRGALFEQRVTDLQSAAGSSGDIGAVLRAGTEGGFYAKASDELGRSRWTRVSAEALERDPATNAAARNRSDSRVAQVRQRIDRLRPQGASSASELRSAQFEGMMAGARLSEVYDISESGSFKDAGERVRFTDNVNAAVSQGMTDVNTYNRMDLSGLNNNPSGRNEARSVFAANANLDHMSSAWTRASGDKDGVARQSIAGAVRTIHNEGTRVERAVMQYNKSVESTPEKKVELSAVRRAAQNGNQAEFTAAIKSMNLTMDEGRALAQKRKIDDDTLLSTFRQRADVRARAARRRAAQMPEAPAAGGATPPVTPPPPPTDPIQRGPDQYNNA